MLRLRGSFTNHRNCARTQRHESKNMCGPVEDAFYKIHYANWKSMYNERVHEEMIHDSRAYGDHLWNKLSHGRVEMVPSSIVERMLRHTRVQRGGRMCLVNA